MLPIKNVLALHDLAAYGRCSLTCVIPVLSAMGIKVCPLPTALYSSDTGGFGAVYAKDLTEEMPSIAEQWSKNEITFSGMLVGYLGNEKQIDHTKHIAETLLAGGPLIVDPVMADHGRLYAGFDEAYVAKMRELVAAADYILPNITEACLLTGIPYQQTYDRQYVEELLFALRSLGAKTVILTGVSLSGDNCGVAVLEGEVVQYYGHKRIPRDFHGTGDIFAAVFAGAILQGQDAFRAAAKAADFVLICIENTPGNQTGVRFEPYLRLLYDSVTDRNSSR